MSDAARGGALDLVQYLKGLGVPDGYGAYFAAQSGYLDILQFLYCRDCAHEADLCATAAAQRNLIILKWLHDNGSPWGNFEEVVCTAAESNSMKVLLWLQQQGNVFAEHVMKWAVEHGSTTIIEWLHAHDCPWSDDILCAAAFNAHTDLFMWLHHNGCPGSWHAAVQVNDICWCAAAGGCVEVLEYCEAQRGQWSATDLTVMLNAAGIWDRLDAVKWLRERGAD
jgi:hypothetical protein